MIRIVFLFLLIPLTISANAAINSDRKDNFLVISDIHLAQPALHTMDINPASAKSINDLDAKTWTKLLSEINKNIKKGTIAKPQFIIVLGDIAGHLRLFNDSVLKSETNVFKALKVQFPNTPIFYTFGNNDSLKNNYGPFQDTDRLSNSQSPYDIAMKKSHWNNGFLSTGQYCHDQPITTPCLITENTTNGYYAAYLKSKLRLISINSVLFSTKRSHINEQAANDELQWLEKQLRQAKVKQESVLITLHIPPGNNVYDHTSFWFPKEQNRFLTLISHYQTNIIGILAGHTHAEELKIVRSAHNTPIAGIYFTAALSTSHGNAPAIKTFYLAKNNNDWRLSNYDMFYFLQGKTKVSLRKLYDYKNHYCPPGTQQLLRCLNHITAAKINTYFTAGNPNNKVEMNSPQDINIILE